MFEWRIAYPSSVVLTHLRPSRGLGPRVASSSLLLRSYVTLFFTILVNYICVYFHCLSSLYCNACVVNFTTCPYISLFARTSYLHGHVISYFLFCCFSSCLISINNTHTRKLCALRSQATCAILYSDRPNSSVCILCCCDLSVAVLYSGSAFMSYSYS